MKRWSVTRKIFWISFFLLQFILIFLASALFLNPTSVGNPRFIWNVNLWAVIWALNFVIILILSFILARSIIKLFFEYQKNQPGSRIKTKLVTTLTVFSLFPTLIMFFLFVGLINRNLIQWFGSPAEQLLEDSVAIAERYHQEKKSSVLAALRSTAERVRSNGAEQLPLGGELSLEGWALFDLEGELLHQTGPWPSVLPYRTALPEVLSGETFYQVERLSTLDLAASLPVPEEERVLTDIGLAGVPLWGDSGEIVGALFTYFRIPDSVSFHAARVYQAAEKHEALKSGTSQLYVNYYSILALTALALIFGFVWLGTYIAKRITIPLEALAEGSRELAGGNLDYRVEVKAGDELGILVQSFNRMADEIRQSRHDLEQANGELLETNVQLDERRLYIETVLQNIATAVISVDEADVIHTVNEAACKMFQVDRHGILDRKIQQVAGREIQSEYLRLKTRAQLFGTARQEITMRRGDGQLYIAATMTSNFLPATNQAGYVIVLDDLTELIRAEKFAAWQEVARRLAHEIKNPLTPIQLSAERIQKRFEKIQAVPGAGVELQEFGKVLKDATRIIVAEAEILKTLVQEFSRFARLPICNPVETRLNDMIEETLALYDGHLDAVKLHKCFDPEIRSIRVDPEQLRRVFVNLIDNSLDALAEVPRQKRIEIRTHLNPTRGSVTIELHDNGVGIASEDFQHLFLPYFSRKKKGTGLGLAIVRQIVSEHNGSIRAEPNLPHGTRFVLELPVG